MSNDTEHKDVVESKPRTSRRLNGHLIGFPKGTGCRPFAMAGKGFRQTGPQFRQGRGIPAAQPPRAAVDLKQAVRQPSAWLATLDAGPSGKYPG
jgi:hypothetical protein